MSFILLQYLSFYFALNTDNRINYGPVLENVIYAYLKSKNYNLSVGYIGKFECDFILRSNEQDYSYLQVAYTILQSIETEDREYRPLEGIRDNYKKYVINREYLGYKWHASLFGRLAIRWTNFNMFVLMLLKHQNAMNILKAILHHNIYHKLISVIQSNIAYNNNT